MIADVEDQIGGRRATDEALYERHAVELVRFATVLVGPSGADDLVAEAVVKVFSNPSWPTVEAPRSYLYRAVLNEARQQGRSNRRRERRERRAAGRDDIEAPTVRPEVLVAMRRMA